MTRNILKRGVFFLMNVTLMVFVAYTVGIFQHNYTFMPDYARFIGPAVMIEYTFVDSDGRESTMLGSGTAIAKRQLANGTWEIDILTVKHVIGNAKNEENGIVTWKPLTITRWVIPYNGTSPVFIQQQGHVVRLSEKYDLALVRVTSGDPFPTAEIARTQVKIGETVCAVGSPNGLPPTLTCGRMSFDSYKLPGYDTEVLYTNTLVWSGNSGGALYNEKYELVGVSMSLWGSPHLSFFVKLEHILEFLHEYV